jgi:hypothetical protein
MRYRELLALCALSTMLFACANVSSNVAASAPVNWTAEHGKKVLLIDPDVELSEITFGGVPQPHADWTATAKGFIKTGIATQFTKKGIEIAPVDGVSDPREVQLVKLHGAVGLSMLQNMMINLPTKKNNFDWTLGPGVESLRTHYNGDYALFVYVRDSYSSGSRMAMSLLLGVPTGAMQVGFASLVDLRTGRIVWFNRLISSTGSLKTDKGAAASVDNLLHGMPL